MTLRVAKPQGHDDIAELPDMTSDREKQSSRMSKIHEQKWWPWAISSRNRKALGFSNNKARRHVDYLDEVERVRYSPHLNEVVINQVMR